MLRNAFIGDSAVVVSLIPCTCELQKNFYMGILNGWFFQTTHLMNYEGIYLLPSQKLQHRQVPASLFCRSLNNVHKGCILVNKLLHIQCSFLPACVEKENARVRSNMPLLPVAFSSFWYCSLFFFFGCSAFLSLLKNSIRAHKWVSPEHFLLYLNN